MPTRRRLILLAVLACNGDKTPSEPGDVTPPGGTVDDTGDVEVPALLFDGIERAIWDGGDGLAGEWSAATAAELDRYTLEIAAMDGELVASVDTQDLSASSVGLAEGEYRLRALAWPADGSEPLGGDVWITQYVGENRLVFRSTVFLEGVADVWGQDEIIVVAGRDSGNSFYVFDAADPTDPELLAAVPDQGFVKDVKIGDGLLFTNAECGCSADSPEWEAYDHIGVRIFDFSDPANPALIGTIGDVSPSVHNVAYGDGYLYLSENTTDNVHIYDVRDPTNPAYVDEWVPPPDGNVHDQTWVDGRLYVAWWGGFTVLDVSDPTAPTLVSELIGGNNIHNAWPSQDAEVVFTTSEMATGDLRVYDVSDPAKVNEIGSFTSGFGTSVHNVHVRGSYAYVSYYTEGVIVLDISDPAFPVEVGRYDTLQHDHPSTDHERPEPDDTGADTGGVLPDTGVVWPSHTGDTGSSVHAAPADTGDTGVEHYHRFRSPFDGCWGVWPDGPHIAASDMQHGLFLFDFFEPVATP